MRKDHRNQLPSSTQENQKKCASEARYDGGGDGGGGTISGGAIGSGGGGAVGGGGAIDWARDVLAGLEMYDFQPCTQRSLQDLWIGLLQEVGYGGRL